MHIYFLDKNPYWAARFYSDYDIVPGLNSCSQILVNGYYKDNLTQKLSNVTPTILEFLDKQQEEKSIESTWACRSLSNWSWILLLGMCLCVEYNARFNEPHSKALAFRWFFKNPPTLPQNLPLSEFPYLDGKMFTSKDTIKNWREFYKAQNGKWEHGVPEPSWYHMQPEENTHGK